MNRKIALITGGSRGIGKHVCIQLAKDGYDIWLNYNSNDEAANEVKKQIETFDKSCKLLKFDVSKSSQVKDVLGKEVNNMKENEELNILVNNVGIVRDNTFLWMTEDEWLDVINTNLNGFFYVTKAVIRKMMEGSKGNIINIGSISGEIGNFGQSNYSAAKAGLISATKSLSKELARNNIRVNVIIPGIINTEMVPEEMKNNKKIKKTISMKRFGEPGEIAKTISFIVSDDASYITGALIPVTGGFII